MAISVPSQFHISVCTSKFRRLDWTGAIPPLINTPSSLGSVVVTTGFFPRPISAQILHSGRRECGQKVLQLLPQFIHHTDTLQNEAGGAAARARRPSPGREAGSQTEVICFRSYQSHSLETGNGFALPPPLPPLSRHLRLAEEPTTQQGQISPSLRNSQVVQICEGSKVFGMIQAM